MRKVIGILFHVSLVSMATSACQSCGLSQGPGTCTIGVLHRFSPFQDLFSNLRFMSSSKPAGKISNLKRANPSTIQDKFLVGYQGWFTCAGDGEPVDPGHHGWLHWFDCPLPDGGRPNTDLWPDVSDYSPSELYPAPGLKSADGEQMYLFSSRHPKTVQRHFHQMAEHGVDGAFLQRFLGQCDVERGTQGIRKIRDEVGERVKDAAEKEGRVFAIMYDISGVDSNRVLHIIERDWIHLLREKCILDSPNYLREKGKAVVAIWGFGFDKAGHTPELVRAVTSFIRSNTPGGAYIMGGAPSQWRTSEGDAERNPALLDVWLTEFDAISPWTVGRYSNEDEADRFTNERMKGDVELLKTRCESGLSKKIDYIPVVLPGGSGYNLSEGKWGLNGIKRNGGRFLWRQIYNACQLGTRIIYGAMWDEYDEGTAFLPVVPNKRLLPVHDKFPFLALDADGYDLPSDWYMRICGLATEGLHKVRLIEETFPVKELQDYWATRPISDGDNEITGCASSREGQRRDTGESSASQSYQAWLQAQQESKEDVPPPPYCLVEEGVTVLNPPDEHPTNALEPPAEAPSVAITAATEGISVLPAASSPSPSIGVHASSRPVIDDPVTSLTNDFGKQTISESTSFNSSSHPHHQRPNPSRPPTHQRPNLLSPNTQPHSFGMQNQGGSPRPPFHLAPGSVQSESSGPWSQAPWPPPEWKLPPQSASHNAQTAPIHDGLHRHGSSSSCTSESSYSSLGAPAHRPHSPVPGHSESSSQKFPTPMPTPGKPHYESPSSTPPVSISNDTFTFPTAHTSSPASSYPGQAGVYNGIRLQG
ncbi:hypothetical protein M378DRAFT_129485 [Amanita muscaria Koide BX008]|uniref:Xylosidase/arabinosidase n=1 Tax=Amanita muscaria (strain Koide BX008) TaxID=946122 RepID=A0A0C2WY73_AMAMK|nr:hypothetical protein M378DRAFT_129485 [Amanita muscaria Koide BX008]